MNNFQLLEIVYNESHEYGIIIDIYEDKYQISFDDDRLGLDIYYGESEIKKLSIVEQEYARSKSKKYFEKIVKRFVKEFEDNIDKDDEIDLMKDKYENGCRICNDTSNDRYYRNEGYAHCPRCGDKL